MKPLGQDTPNLFSQPVASAPSPTGTRILTVSELTAAVKLVLARGLPPTLHVVGQVSNLKRHNSGHLYLTLKDDFSELPCVMWRSAAETLKFQPHDGMEVVATGSLDVYERSGRYQLYIRRLEPRGIGALELAFRQLHQRLAAEGLFDPQRKQKLPLFPKRIALVTSPTGAAIRDIVVTLRRRYAPVDVFLVPVRVQGETAAAEIAGAIDRLNRWSDLLGGIDLMIVGRGGGSLEDLWAFNEEIVARAVFASRIPVISAVGHETDVTICDLVADVRAATPTAGAEIAVPNIKELLATLDRMAGNMSRWADSQMTLAQTAWSGLLRRPWYREPDLPIRKREQYLDETTARMARLLATHFHDRERRWVQAERAVQRIQPHVAALRAKNRLAEVVNRLRYAMEAGLRAGERWLGTINRRFIDLSPRHALIRRSDQIFTWEKRVKVALEHRIRQATSSLHGQHLRLEALGYRKTLQRGYTITRSVTGGRLIRSAAEVTAGELVLTETADGEIRSQVIPSPPDEVSSSHGR